MAHRIARIVRSALLDRSVQCSRILTQSRYYASPSKSEDPAAAKSEAPEVSYERKPKSQKKSKSQEETTASAGSKPQDKPLPAEESNAAANYPKKANPNASPPSGKVGKEAKEKAGTGVDESKANAGYAKKSKPAAEDSKTKESPAAASEATKVDEAAPKASEEAGDVPDVGYKRRVMPLPEDREAPAAEESEDPQVKKMRSAFVPTYDYELPLPKIIKMEEKKKKSPVSLADAIQLVKESAHCKFVETLEAHIQLGVDPKRSDQIVRGAVTLPHGSGRVMKVAVFADGPAADEALAAGADVVGTDELIEKVFASGGKLDFDKCIAVPSVMPKLGKVARILGPRGLMPNPKMGTVTVKVGEAVRAAKKGRVDFRADKAAIVHAGLGKVNFTDEALHDNIAAFAAAVVGAKPTGFKKSSRYSGYFLKFYLCCTMGPGVPVSIQSVAGASDQYMKTQEAAAQALLRSAYDYC